MARLLQANKKETVTQTIAYYNQAIQTSIKKANQMCCLVWSLDFCCYIQVVGSEFGIKNMEAWIHPALCQRLRLTVVV